MEHNLDSKIPVPYNLPYLGYPSTVPLNENLALTGLPFFIKSPLTFFKKLHNFIRPFTLLERKLAEIKSIYFYFKNSSLITMSNIFIFINSVFYSMSNRGFTSKPFLEFTPDIIKIKILQLVILIKIKGYT